LYRVAAWAEKQFHECLVRSPLADAARRYLQERGVSWTSVERFHLGYSPDQWQWLLDRSKSTSFSAGLLEAAGLLGKSAESGQLYDRFRGRLIFSIRDPQHRPIAFGGRILPGKQDDRGAKYVNSPATRLFTKSDQLYGLDVARDAIGKTRSVVVVEGYTDVIIAHQFGLDNVVAVLGTALGPQHVRILRRYADTVTLVLDGDEAGQRRSDEILELFVAEQVDLRVATLPGGVDPCDFVARHGAEEFRRLTSSAVDALEQRTRVATRGIDLATQPHRASRALEEILGTLAKAPRLRSSTTASIRLREQQVLSTLARRFRVAESELRSRLQELRRRLGAGPTPQETPPPMVSRLDPKEAELLEILSLHPALAPSALEQVSADRFAEGPARAVYETYHRRYAAGLPLEFDRVLTELEAPALKHVLVQLEERSRAKAPQAEWDAHTRLLDLALQFRRQAEQTELDAKAAALESGKLDEKEELAHLEFLLEQERNRQGISEPTDG
jgi:DNA primase